MWKKSETEEYSPQPAEEPSVSKRSMPEPPPSKRPEHAVIGSTISIHGDLAGEEDLLIEGKL